MNTRSILSAITATAASLTLFVVPVLAQTPAATPPQNVTESLRKGLDSAAAGYGTQRPELPAIVAGLINVALTLLGSLLLIYLIYGGFLWMTAQGDEKKVDKARSLIKNAIVGVVIVTAAYAISSYVITELSRITTGGTSE